MADTLSKLAKPEGSTAKKTRRGRGVGSGLGKTAGNLQKLGARAVLFVQLDDPLGLSDVLNYVAVAPGKDTLAARFEGAVPGMGALTAMLAGPTDGPVSIVMSVPDRTQTDIVLLPFRGLPEYILTIYRTTVEPGSAAEKLIMEGTPILTMDAT